MDSNDLDPLMSKELQPAPTTQRPKDLPTSPPPPHPPRRKAAINYDFAVAVDKIKQLEQRYEKLVTAAKVVCENRTSKAYSQAHDLTALRDALKEIEEN